MVIQKMCIVLNVYISTVSDLYRVFKSGVARPGSWHFWHRWLNFLTFIFQLFLCFLIFILLRATDNRGLKKYSPL